MQTVNAITLYKFLKTNKNEKYPGLGELIIEVATACKMIANIVSTDALEHLNPDLGGDTNVQGEVQKPLDVISNDIFINQVKPDGLVRAIASEEMDTIVPIESGKEDGKYLLVFDPLDGSSNIDVNISIGSIFSILEAPEEKRLATEEDFFQVGNRQIAAGFTVYGPSTKLVLTLGNGVYCFTLNSTIGEFLLTDSNIKIPEDTKEYAINASNARHWEEPVKKYVADCLAGKEGPRGKDFNMRWVASLVAEAYRIMKRGGIFLYPRDDRDPKKPSRLRFLYEANPVGFIIEQAGGKVSTGTENFLNTVPHAIHQRIPLVFGSKNEVEVLESYHKQ